MACLTTGTATAEGRGQPGPLRSLRERGAPRLDHPPPHGRLVAAGGGSARAGVPPRRRSSRPGCSIPPGDIASFWAPRLPLFPGGRHARLLTLGWVAWWIALASALAAAARWLASPGQGSRTSWAEVFIGLVGLSSILAQVLFFNPRPASWPANRIRWRWRAHGSCSWLKVTLGLGGHVRDQSGLFLALS